MSLENRLVSSVENAIERNAMQNGNITHSSVSKILRTHQKEMSDKMQYQLSHIDRKLSALIATLNSQSNNNQTPFIMPNNNHVQQNSTTIQRTLHYWDGKYWHVPKNFDFPKACTLRRAFEMWLVGLPNFKNESSEATPIMPFRRMNPKSLPKKLANKFKIEWRPILSKMLEAPNLSEEVRGNANSISRETVEKSYAIGTSYLQTVVITYLWQEEKFRNCVAWTVGTWSKRVKYSEIMKHGTAGDTTNLPPATQLNKKRKTDQLDNPPSL